MLQPPTVSKASKGFLLKARLENKPQIKITPPVSPCHGAPPAAPGAGGEAGTYANNSGDEEEHQHGDVEHDDPQQQQQHLGGGGGQNWRGRRMLLGVRLRVGEARPRGRQEPPQRQGMLGQRPDPPLLPSRPADRRGGVRTRCPDPLPDTCRGTPSLLHRGGLPRTPPLGSPRGDLPTAPLL